MWHDDDKISIVYNVIDNPETLFPSICPICNKQAAHVYVSRHNNQHGGIWAWCSACGASSHMSGIVPLWWQNPDFIDECLLSAEPDYLNSMADRIDSWMNSLPRTENIKKEATFTLVDRFKVVLKAEIQGIPAGSIGTLIISDNFQTKTIQFVPDNGEAFDVDIPPEQLMKFVDICH